MSPRASAPWRPPLFEVLRSARQRRALSVPAPAPEGETYLRAFLRAPTRWRYAVLDEIVDDMAGLVVAPWPTLDAKGRLRASGQAPRGATISGTFTVDAVLSELQTFVDLHRARAHAAGLIHDSALVNRPLRIGDAFALTVVPREPAGSHTPPTPPDQLLAIVDDDKGRRVLLQGVPGPKDSGVEHGFVLDVSFDAREASRIAYYAAMAPTLERRRERDHVLGSALEGLAAQHRREG